MVCQMWYLRPVTIDELYNLDYPGNHFGDIQDSSADHYSRRGHSKCFFQGAFDWCHHGLVTQSATLCMKRAQAGLVRITRISTAAAFFSSSGAQLRLWHLGSKMI